jgi:hypothetical protein
LVLDGSANGLTAASPAGGNFVALFSAFPAGTGPLTQTISGLTAGQTYTLTFWMAAGQQMGFSGATTDQLTVSLGTSSKTTGTLSVASEGFSPWQQVTESLTADSTTDVLSFLASGSPSGMPPVVLLDGVDLESGTPPVADTTSTVLLFGFALAIMGVAPLSRRLCRN